MGSNLGCFLSRAARAFKIHTNLLTAGTGCIEVFLRIALNLRGAAPARRDFVPELAEPVGQFGLINGRGELLRGEKTLRLDGARLSIVALGDVENDGMCMELRRDIAIDRASCIVLKLSGDKFPCGLWWMIAADAG